MARAESPLVEHAKRGPSQKEKEPRRSRKRRKALMSKEERLKRNAKGWMEGMREKAMSPLVSEYADARLCGSKAEQLKMKELLSKFHFWFPYPLEDHEEPADPELKPYDPHYVEPEGTAEYEAAKGAHLKKYNERVKAWIKARAKTIGAETKDSKNSANTRFNAVMARLANKSRPVRARSAQQQWQSANWATGAMLEATVLKEWEEATGFKVPAGECRAMEGEDAQNAEDEDARPEDGGEKLPYPTIDFVCGVVGRLFKALPEEDRERWKADAKEEARLDREEYQALLAEPVQGDPASRATCVRNTPEFISQFNRGIEIASSLRLTTLAAGPMARKQGDVGFFMVTTLVNRAVVPMSFQEWYGEEKTKALMESYKEWVESCLSPSEVQEVMGTGAVSNSLAYTGALGKGFTTDDMGVIESQAGPSGTPSTEGGHVAQVIAPSKTRKIQVEKSRPLRRKAGEEPLSDSSGSDSDDGLDEWSGRSSSEQSTISDDSSDEEPAAPGSAMARVDASLKSLRRDWKEKKDAKKRKRIQRSKEKPSRRSKRRKRGDEAMADGGRSGAEGGGEEEERSSHASSSGVLGAVPKTGFAVAPPNAGEVPPAPVPDADDVLSVSDADDNPAMADASDALPVPKTGNVLPVPGAANTLPVPDTDDSPAIPDAGDVPPLPDGDAENLRSAMPSTMKSDDAAIQDLIVLVSPEAGIGLERRTLKIAAGIGSIAGLLQCGTRGLDFMLLPFNEFLQAKGGDRLRHAMALLVAIETCLLGGYVSDASGRKKAVIPVATRPNVLSGWIIKGRCRVGRAGMPVARMVIGVNELPTFLKTWNIWWSALQPAWRVKAGVNGWKRETYGEDWHSMIIPGQNGLLSVVATLSWWGSAAMAGNGETDWMEAVIDVEWMMAGLLGFLERRQT